MTSSNDAEGPQTLGAQVSRFNQLAANATTAGQRLQSVVATLRSCLDSLRSKSSCAAQDNAQSQMAKHDPKMHETAAGDPVSQAPLSENVEELEEEATIVLLHTANLRKHHRDLHVGIQAAVKSADPLKAHLTNARLEVENLMCERDLLNLEIKRCRRDGELDLEGVELMSAEELESMDAAQGTEPQDWTAPTTEKVTRGGDPEDRRLEEEHDTLLRRLNGEIRVRQSMSAEVERQAAECAALKKQLEKEKSALANLPSDVKSFLASARSLADQIHDVEHAGENNSAVGGDRDLEHMEEFERIRDLPSQLYTLAREIISLRDATGGCVDLNILDETATASKTRRLDPAVPELPPDPGAALRTGSKRGREATDGQAPAGAQSGTADPTPAADSLTTLHEAHKKVVRLLVFGAMLGDCPSDDSKRSGQGKPETGRKRKRETLGLRSGDSHAQCAAFLFRFHPRLGIVSVEWEPESGVVEGTTDNLSHMVPLDGGNTSPNPAHRHLLAGQFRFDGSIVSRDAKPFVWANLMCGIHCSAAFKGPEHADYPELATTARWLGRVASLPSHVRFVGLMKKLAERIATVRSLSAQLSQLRNRMVAVKATVIDRASPAKARFSELKEIPKEDIPANQPETPDDLQPCRLFSTTVSHSGGVALEARIALFPDYPLTPARFQLRSASTGPEPTDAGVWAAEQRVNSDDYARFCPDKDRDSDAASDDDNKNAGALTLTPDPKRAWADMTLSAQMQTLLACVDDLADGRSHEHSAADWCGQQMAKVRTVEANKEMDVEESVNGNHNKVSSNKPQNVNSESKSQPASQAPTRRSSRRSQGRAR